MSDYFELTNQLTNQWITALRHIKEALPTLDDEVKLVPPGFALSDLDGKFPTLPGLPTAQEVVEANFQVAQRFLQAQRDLTLSVIERAASVGLSDASGTTAESGSA
ncbi:MAG: hypothetical protein WAV90_13470 [Gordonia amarae]